MTTNRTVHVLDRSGLIRDWLVGPAWSTSCDDLDAVLEATGSPWGPDGRWVLTNGPDVAPLKERLHRRRPLVLDQRLPEVVERGPLFWKAPGGHRLDTATWSRYRAGRDGLLDWSQFCYTPQYRHAVAATVLEVDQAERRQLEIACTGPFAVWLGSELVATHDDVSYMEPVRHEVTVRLPSGATPLLVATWQVAFRECRHIASVRVLGQPVRVVIPSPGADEYASATAEQVLDRVAVRSWALDDGVVRLTGPAGASLTVERDGRSAQDVVLHDGRAELRLLEPDAASGGDVTASMLSTGETALRVRVNDDRCPVERTLRVAVLPPSYRATPQGEDPARWRDELLRHVAGSHPGSARALARATLEGTAVPTVDVDPPLAMVEARADCADFEAVGLMHLWHRVDPAGWEDGVRERVRRALLDFKYWIDQPGLDAMCYFTENHQFVWHTAEFLVGTTFAEDTFSNTGWSGARHAEHGRGLALEWMRRKLAGGFSEFDSNAYLAIDSLALVSLVDLSPDEEVARTAEALLDVVLLSLAANSFRGVHGAAHGRSYTPTLRSSRLEETGPIMWVMWGTGALNSAVLPATTLALAQRYRLPKVVRRVATELPDSWCGRQVYRGTYRLHHDLLSRPYGSDLHVWRTPDGMLSSVQDYRSGLPGLQEHVWGATLGPEVQVFATLPAADTTGPSARPNAWAGQRVLPRVRQHRDSLLVVHGGLPESSSTHLWFPTPLMDEVRRHRHWVAGRVGDGYVAVAADGGFEDVVTGDEAGQVWLPRAGGSAYAVSLGRAARDGTFADFVERLADPCFDTDADGDPRVRWTTTDGRRLELAWTGPFLVDDAVVGLDAGRPEQPPHIANPAVHLPHGENHLVARWAGEHLVLDLAAGRRLEPASGVGDQSSEVAGAR